MPRAYDLIGTVMFPAEVFPRLDALEAMAKTLEDAGHTDAAAETRQYLTEAQAFAELTTMRLNRLRGVWLAVEAVASPHLTGDGRLRVEHAVDAYRERSGG